MTPSGSTLLFGAISTRLKPSSAEKRSLSSFIHLLTRTVAATRPFVCLLADDSYLQQLNRQFLGHDYPTDVLSFPSGTAAGELGDIAISLERAGAQAAEFGHPALDEVRILMLHGLLHLTGLDHETGDPAMNREEKRWRKEFGLPETLIARSPARRIPSSRKGAA